MSAVCISRNAASCATKQAQHGRRLRHVERTRQQVEVSLDQVRDRRPMCGRIPLRAANDFLIDAQRQFRHIRIISTISYVSCLVHDAESAFFADYRWDLLDKRSDELMTSPKARSIDDPNVVRAVKESRCATSGDVPISRGTNRKVVVFVQRRLAEIRKQPIQAVQRHGGRCRRSNRAGRRN